MNKIEEAQEILKELGLPEQQQNKISALTLLALAGIKNNSEWISASQNNLTLRRILLSLSIVSIIKIINPILENLSEKLL